MSIKFDFNINSSSMDDPVCVRELYKKRFDLHLVQCKFLFQMKINSQIFPYTCMALNPLCQYHLNGLIIAENALNLGDKQILEYYEYECKNLDQVRERNTLMLNEQEAYTKSLIERNNITNEIEEDDLEQLYNILKGAKLGNSGLYNSN